MTRKPFSLAAAAVSALAIATLGMGAPAALAAPGDPTIVNGADQEAVNPALINPDADVQLSIHKHLGAPTGQTADGTEKTVTTDRLAGVPFDVYQVQYYGTVNGVAGWYNVDLTTNTGWTAAAAVQGAKPAADGTFTVKGVDYKIVKVTTTPVVTDSTGTATFTKTDGVGLYYVMENLSAVTETVDGVKVVTNVDATNNPNTAVDETKVPVSSITPSAPFFVTLPMTQPGTTSSWMYDVNVYPKNQADSITKTVNDETTYTIGSPITYTLTSTISPIAKLGYYYIGDSNEYLGINPTDTKQGVSLKISGDKTDVALTGCDGTKPGTGSCDYFYWLDSDATKAGSQLEIAFTDAGLKKLQDAKAADTTAQVVTTISGTVESVPADGAVPNTGSFIPNSDWYTNNGGTTPVKPPVDDPTNPNPPTPQDPTVPGIPS